MSWIWKYVQIRDQNILKLQKAISFTDFYDEFQATVINNMQPAMYKSLTDMVDDNSMMDLSQYFRLGKIQFNISRPRLLLNFLNGQFLAHERNEYQIW